MVEFDINFKRASAETDLELFREELACNFSNWLKIPSPGLQFHIAGWLEMGSDAYAAYCQRIANNYRSYGIEAALPEALRAITNQAEFDKWSSIATQKGMANWKPRWGAIAKPDIDGPTTVNQLKKMLSLKCLDFNSEQKPVLSLDLAQHGETALGTDFKSEQKPVLRLSSGGALYIDIDLSSRQYLIAIRMYFFKKEVGYPFPVHNGLHGVVQGCELKQMTDEKIDILVSETIRHLECLKKYLQ